VQETLSMNGAKGKLYRDQIKKHVLICKFIGLWPIERMLCNWIIYQWKPSGEVDLHLGSKGFFTIVFMNLKYRDKIFEGGGGGILPCLSRTVHATMEGKILCRK
jgi:hypothetical protein